MDDFIFNVSEKGYLISRESFDLEYKESFHFGDSLAEYVRSMVGMANNRGGKLIFGVQNSPRIPVGLKNQKFQECDPNKVNQFIVEYFSHEFYWDLKTLDCNSLEFGQILIDECQLKPVICRKTYKNILREGAVYYRYRGETKEINYPELSTILDNERKKERLLWLQHIEKISAIGPKNVHFMDTYRGEVHIGNEKVLIDPALLDKIKFIKEGHFVEKDGAPTLTLAGEITGILDTNRVLPTDKAYPYLAKDFCKAFSINQHQVMCLFWKLNVKNNPKYHDSIITGSKTRTHKYSESLKSRLSALLKRYPNYIDEACKEFSIDQAAKKNNSAN